MAAELLVTAWTNRGCYDVPAKLLSMQMMLWDAETPAGLWDSDWENTET